MKLNIRNFMVFAASIREDALFANSGNGYDVSKFVSIINGYSITNLLSNEFIKNIVYNYAPFLSPVRMHGNKYAIIFNIFLNFIPNKGKNRKNIFYSIYIA